MSTARPIIGVTCDFLPVRGETKLTVRERYVDSLQRAGALVMILPPSIADIPAQLTMVDGLVLTGGDDLDPRLWGGEPGPDYIPSDPRRTEYELSLALAAMDADLPLLGICLGAQLMNVACGGSLRADLPPSDIVHHDAAQGLLLRHDVDIMKDSLLARAMGLPRGGRASVNSSHHNAPDGLGEKLRACALAADGIIEGVEHRDLSFCLGVQWHPEADVATNPGSMGLFSSLVEACLAGRAAHR